MARNSGWPTIANERSTMQLRDDLVLPGRVIGRLKDGEPVLLEGIPPRARSERSRGAFLFTAMWGSAAVACSARAAGPTRSRGSRTRIPRGSLSPRLSTEQLARRRRKRRDFVPPRILVLDDPPSSAMRRLPRAGSLWQSHWSHPDMVFAHGGYHGRVRAGRTVRKAAARK